MSAKWDSPMSLKWKRPGNIVIPTTWATFEGRPLENGQVPKFRIQDVTDDQMEKVVDHMGNNFLVDEPYCRFLDGKSDPDFVENIRAVWRWVLNHRIGLICLLENGDELSDKSLPQIAGVNLTYPIFPDSPDIITKNKDLNDFFDMVTKTLKVVDCFEKYNTDVIMYALGLSVDRAYRGQGIGEQLLRARYPLARALGITVTNVVFSGNFSQAAGRKAGFDVLGEILAEDYLVDGKPIYKGVKDSRCMQLHARTIPSAAQQNEI